jgi:hypothetical protein
LQQPAHLELHKKELDKASLDLQQSNRMMVVTITSGATAKHLVTSFPSPLAYKGTKEEKLLSAHERTLQDQPMIPSFRNKEQGTNSRDKVKIDASFNLALAERCFIVPNGFNVRTKAG